MTGQPSQHQDHQRHHHSHHQTHHASDEDLLQTAIPIDESDLADDDTPTNPPASSSAAPQPRQSAAHQDTSPIEIEEDEPETNQAQQGQTAQTPRRSSKITAFGNEHQHHEHQWKRQPVNTGKGAVRVKTFVAKLRLDAIEHLDEQINEWLDAHPEYEVKFTTTSIGPLIGKLTEDALFVNVWV